MVDDPSGPGPPPETVGLILAGMRRARRLTGAQVGRLAGLSQSTISRLETGQNPPDPDHVARVAAALDATSSEVERLVQMAEFARDRTTEWQPLPVSLAARQRDVGGWEAGARTIQVFQPTVIVGLLQTSGYARAVLSKFSSTIRQPAEGMTDVALGEAVAARLQRHIVLDDARRSFRFVMAESVLTNRICSPIDMVAQIHHLLDMSKRANITIGLVQTDQEWTVPPLHGFVILDETTVMIDLLNTGIESEEKADARTYRAIFEMYEAQATTDIEPILRKYLEQYLDLSTKQIRRPDA
jgi:transcriptional regulator with XRE-family HTH domain